MNLIPIVETLKFYLAVLVFCLNFKKRTWFPVRLCGCFMLHLMLLQQFVSLANGSSVGLFISYCADYVMMFVFLRFCYLVSWPQAVFTTTAGRATKFFIANFIFLISISGELFPWWGELISNILQMLIIYLPFCVLAYFAFARRISTEEYNSPQNEPLKMVSALTVFVCTFINRFVKDFGPRQVHEIVAESLYGMICSLLCLYLQFEICRRIQTQSNERAIHALWQEEQKRLDDTKKIMEQINIKCHDIRHKIADSELHITDAEKKELHSLIQIYDRQLETGCPTLNVLLAEQSLLCEQLKIQFSFMGDAACLNKLNESEIYSLFGNALGNAVNASSDVEEDKRQISMIIQCRGSLVSISITNYYSGVLKLSDGLPLTTSQENPQDHGYGMKSMQLIAQKHGGNIKVTADDHIFTLMIWFMNT